MQQHYPCSVHGHHVSMVGAESTVMRKQSTVTPAGPSPAPPLSQEPQESRGEGPADLRQSPSSSFLEFTALPGAAALFKPCALRTCLLPWLSLPVPTHRMPKPPLWLLGEASLVSFSPGPPRSLNHGNKQLHPGCGP